MDYENHEDAPEDLEEFIVRMASESPPTNTRVIEQHKEFWDQIGEERIVNWLDEWIHSLRDDDYYTEQEVFSNFLDALEELGADLEMFDEN